MASDYTRPSLAAFLSLQFLLFLCQRPHLAEGGELRIRRDGEKIKVTSIEEPPYLMVKNPGSTSPDNFEGFIPDLLKAVAARAGFTYQLKLVSDGAYGTPAGDGTGAWTGMIGEVIRRESDLAAAPITISQERREVVDFSEPFMTFGTTVLSKRPPPFSTISQLANQADIKYGIVKGGITESFFRKSSNKTYRKMWQYMESHPDVLQTNMADGVKKVRESDGKYGFIIEGSTADYWIHKYPCDLAKFGDINVRNHYGFAMKTNSNLMTKVNDAIKALKNNGELKRLKDKWWHADNRCSNAGSSSTLPLSKRPLVWTLAALSSCLYLARRR